APDPPIGGKWYEWNISFFIGACPRAPNALTDELRRFDCDSVDTAPEQVRPPPLGPAVEAGRSPPEVPVPDLRQIGEESPGVGMHVRCKPFGLEHPRERPRREEANMGVAPRLVDGTVVTERVEPADQEQLETAP